MNVDVDLLADVRDAALEELAVAVTAPLTDGAITWPSVTARIDVKTHQVSARP